MCTHNLKLPLVIKYIIINLFLHNSCGYTVENDKHVDQILRTDLSNWLIDYAVQSEKTICCADGQWEASAFLNYGAVLSIPETNSYFYYNGTGRIAFDDTRKMSYIFFNITAFSPQVPVYSRFTVTTIKNFNTGKMYQIDDDGNCSKQTISKNMQIVCIPETSTRLATGEVGTENVTTYQIRTSNRVREQVITASVLENGTHCDPVTVSQAIYVTKGAPQGHSIINTRRLNYASFFQNLEHVFLGSSTKAADGTICCSSGRWEASAFVYANTLLTLENITMPVYYNGTGKIAFDETNKKSYTSFSITEFLPGTPGHYHKVSTTIKDFAQDVTYHIDEDNCFKQPYSTDINIVCVPDNAELISNGDFGGTNVTTYQYTTTDSLETITTASVLQNGNYCETAMISYAMLAEGDVPEQFVYDVDIVDISHGIKDPSVFVPPKMCN